MNTEIIEKRKQEFEELTKLPVGVIVEYSGLDRLLFGYPEGFAECNGENGTPNILLKVNQDSRFIKKIK